MAETKSIHKLYSHNLRCFKDRPFERVDHILTTAVEAKANVMAFQEVCVDKNRNMIKYIYKKLEELSGKKWKGVSKFAHLAWNKYDEFLLIVSSEDIEESKLGLLPNSYFQRAYTALKSKGVWYVNIHLAHGKEQRRSRSNQIGFLVDEFRGTKHVFMGDWNSFINSKEQSFLKNRNYKGYFPEKSYPLPNLKISIDGFWLSSHFKDEDFKIGTWNFLPRRGLYLSDHLGVSLNL